MDLTYIIDLHFEEVNKKEIIKETIEYVKFKLEKDSTGHDWWHIYRVFKLAIKLALKLEANVYICALASLLHDLADAKLVCSEEEGLKEIRIWLEQIKVNSKDIDHIIEIIERVSYKGGTNKKVSSIEGMIVQDADRLDAIGAIGIARTFAYSGAKGRLIYNPNLPVRENLTLEEYRSGNDTAINHFYEKLLKLKNLLNTELAIKIANKRHDFMVEYLEQFLNEWEDIDLQIEMGRK